ncbi:MAG: glycosyltransferase [Acidocella sp.]|nr:glycosyltransferase [Acidocella sp.]
MKHIHELDLSSALAEIPALPERSPIPKMIYQTCRSVRDLPSEVLENIETIKRMNPDWGYELYENNNFDTFIAETYGPNILAFLHRINPLYGVAKADLFRYLLLYVRGGVYLDIKSTTTRPLNESLLTEDRYILSYWQNQPGERFEGFGRIIEGRHVDDRELQQWHIIAAPGHRFLRGVIETVLSNIYNYDSWRFKTGFKGVHATTGPWAYTRAIRPLISADNCRIVENETMVGLGYAIYEDRFEHHKFGGIHYSTRPQPVVIHPGMRMIRAKVYEWMKRFRVLVREGAVG